MSNNFNLINEINNVDFQLSSKEQLSTVDLAIIYNLCDKYIKNKLGVDILTLYEKSTSSVSDITRFILFNLYSEPLLINFFNSYGICDILTQTIYTMGNKKIITIDERILQNSNKTPQQMPVPTDPNQINRIFQALRKNYELYKNLYKEKVWTINSIDNNGNEIIKARIRISPYQFFHLMGFDYDRYLNPNKKDKNGVSHESYAREFSLIFPDSNRAYNLLSEFGKDQKNQYDLIELLLENEERFLNLALSGRLSNTVNLDKLEMKSYAFERMGPVQRATGMILFDKQKAIGLGYGREVNYINSDIILLNDFLRKYEINNLFGLDFVFSPYDKIQGNQISDQQSIFLTRQLGGGFNSHLFDQQLASVSSSVAGYRENNFDFSISENNFSSGDPNGQPFEYKEFSDEERKLVAQTMVEAIPELNQTYLEEIINTKRNKK